MRYKNWACEIPDLDPRGFHPVAGKIRLYGGDGGGGGDGGAAEAASLGFDIGTPGTSTGPSSGAGSGEVSAEDIDAAVDEAVEASSKSMPAAITEPVQTTGNPFGALDAIAEVTAPAAPSTPSGYGINEGIPGLGVSAPSNVVSSPVSGGWMTGSGTGLVSQGMNISLGLDPTHGAIGPYAGTNPNAVNQATLNAIAAELGVPVGQLIGFAGFDEYGNKDYSQISNGLVDYGTLNAAQAAGLGHLGLTNNQTIDQAIAAKNTSDFLDVAVPAAVSVLGSQIPGYGAISTIGRVGAGLLSGTMTPGQAITAGLSGLIGSKTGLPAGMVEAALSGNMGRAAGSGAVSGLSALANALTGNPYAGAIAAATLGPSLGKSVSEAVGGSSSRGGGLPGMLDQGLGTSNWGGLFGGASAPSTSTAPTGNASGDAYGGINPETYAVTAAIEQAAQEAMQPSWKRETVAGRYGPTVQYGYGV